jgi:predicted amidohydrolase
MVCRIGIARSLGALSGIELGELDFLALPEMFNCEFTVDTFRILEDTSRVIDRIRDASSRYPELCIIAGSMPIDDTSVGRRFNRSLVFKKGEIIHEASKRHLFKPFREQTLFAAGKNPESFVVESRCGSIRCGVVICYDLRFPEVTREIVLKGLDILFVPAIWSAERDTPWRTLLAARAIENQIFTVGINSDGRSYCFSPTGECRYESDGIVEYAEFDIDLAEIAEVKQFIDTIEDARE